MLMPGSQIEQHEQEKIVRSARTSFSFHPLDHRYCAYPPPVPPHSLDKTSSTVLLKQPNSLDVDSEDLRGRSLIL